MNAAGVAAPGTERLTRHLAGRSPRTPVPRVRIATMSMPSPSPAPLDCARAAALLTSVFCYLVSDTWFLVFGTIAVIPDNAVFKLVLVQIFRILI
jgi:hypothetical protein